MTDIARLGIEVDSSGAIKATKSLDKLENQGKKTQSMVGTLKTAFIGLGAAISVREVADLADSYTSIENKLKVVTASTGELIEVQNELLAVANETRSEFDTTVSLYAVLARNTTELELSQSRLVRITDIINKSFAASGASAMESAGAIRQLSQGLAAGALRGDEFNSVAEGAPEILRAVTKETGLAIGELRDFAATGGITAELLIRSLENYGETVDQIFGESTATIEQSFTVAHNNAVAFIGGLDSVQTASGIAGEAVIGLSENLDALVDIGQVIALLYGSRVASAMTLSAAATARNTVATLTAVPASTGLSAALGVQTSRATATAIAMNGAALAARGLTAAMTLLGGPLGLLFLAAGSLALYATNSSSATESTEDFSLALKQLQGDIKGVQLIQLNDDIKKTEETLLELQAVSLDYNFFRSVFGDGSEEKQARESIIILEERLELLLEKRRELDKPVKAITAEELQAAVDEKAVERARKSLENLNQQLTGQVETFGKTEAEALRYRLTLGDLSDEAALLGANGSILADSIISQAESLERAMVADELINSYRSLTVAISEQREQLGLSERELFIYQAQARLSAGANDEMLASITRLAGALFDEQKAFELLNSQKQEAASITESVLTVQELYINQLMRIDELEDSGALSAGVAVAARQKAFEDLKGNIDETEEGFKLLTSAVDGWGASFADAMVESTGSFSDFADNMIKQLQKIAIQQATQPLFSAFGDLIGDFAGDIIPEFATGTNFAPGGMALVGERGPELVNLPRGSQVIPNNKISSGGSVNVNVNVDASGSNANSEDDSGKSLGALIGNAVRGIIVQERRPGGLLS